VARGRGRALLSKPCEWRGAGNSRFLEGFEQDFFGVEVLERVGAEGNAAFGGVEQLEESGGRAAGEQDTGDGVDGAEEERLPSAARFVGACELFVVHRFEAREMGGALIERDIGEADGGEGAREVGGIRLPGMAGVDVGHVGGGEGFLFGDAGDFVAEGAGRFAVHRENGDQGAAGGEQTVESGPGFVGRVEMFESVVGENEIEFCGERAQVLLHVSAKELEADELFEFRREVVVVVDGGDAGVGEDGAEEDEFHSIAAANDEEVLRGSRDEIGLPGEVFGDGFSWERMAWARWRGSPESSDSDSSRRVTSAGGPTGRGRSFSTIAARDAVFMASSGPLAKG
jgi:hypothetical protein